MPHDSVDNGGGSARAHIGFGECACSSGDLASRPDLGHLGELRAWLQRARLRQFASLFDMQHRERLAQTSDLDRLARDALGIPASSPGDIFGKDELAPLFFRQGFEPGSGVDRSPDDRDLGRVRVPDAAHDQLPDVKANSNAQRRNKLAFEVRVDFVQREIDGTRSCERLPTSFLGTRLAPEHRHQTIAHVFVDPAVMIDNRLPDRAKELIEDEDDIVRQSLFRQLREAANVEEHDGQRQLDALVLLQ